MLQKISSSAFKGYGPIKVLYPGLSISHADSGIGSIGRIDHAKVQGLKHIPMHPHVNDEILSYFRTGKVKHLDSEGFSDTIGGKRLMLMKAGNSFYHEEYIDGQTEPQEGLQIFIRPGTKDLKPEVIFYDLNELHSQNAWRLLASPSEKTVFRFSSQTWLYDVKLLAGTAIGLPELPDKDLTGLLYVFQGTVKVNQNMELAKQEALIIKDEEITIDTQQGAELVLFLTNENGPVFKGGMYSGNQLSQ